MPLTTPQARRAGDWDEKAAWDERARQFVGETADARFA